MRTGKLTQLPVGVKHAELSAVITRADGTRVDLGILAETTRPSILARIGAFLCRKR